MRHLPPFFNFILLLLTFLGGSGLWTLNRFLFRTLSVLFCFNLLNPCLLRTSLRSTLLDIRRSKTSNTYVMAVRTGYSRSDM